MGNIFGSAIAIARRYDLELRQPAATDHDYCDVSNAMELSEYKEAAISYIAGYVVRMVEKKIHCMQCITALTTTKESIPDLFVTWKTNGGLIDFHHSGLSRSVRRQKSVLGECSM